MDDGSLIKNLRKSKGYSQKDLAKKLHKSTSTISRIENNITHPSRNEIDEILVLLDARDSLSLSLEARERTLTPDMEELVNRIKILPSSEQNTLAILITPTIVFMEDYINKKKEK